MLVLSRRLGESIVIGEGIVITVVDIKSGRAKIGVSAPDDVSVHREEVFNTIMRERMKNETDKN